MRPHGNGLIGMTLNFDYEVRSSEEAFDELPDMKIDGEMLELAKHIINTKKGSFDAKAFDDRGTRKRSPSSSRRRSKGGPCRRRRYQLPPRPAICCRRFARAPEWARAVSRSALMRRRGPMVRASLVKPGFFVFVRRPSGGLASSLPEFWPLRSAPRSARVHAAQFRAN